MDMDNFDNKILPDSIKEKVKDLLPRKDKNKHIWKYFDRYKYNEVYDYFIKVMKEITNQ